MWIKNCQLQDDTGSLQLFFSSESLGDRYITLRRNIILYWVLSGPGGIIDTNVHQ